MKDKINIVYFSLVATKYLTKGNWKKSEAAADPDEEHMAGREIVAMAEEHEAVSAGRKQRNKCWHAAGF